MTIFSKKNLNAVVDRNSFFFFFPIRYIHGFVNLNFPCLLLGSEKEEKLDNYPLGERL